MDEEILVKIYESIKKGERVALAVITEELGSSPRKSGSIMAIWKNGYTIGSVGGGKLEYTVINKAKECIDKKENDNFQFSLNESGLGMQCGGQVNGYIKVFYPKPKLIIVGAGHIGEQLNKIAKVSGFTTVIMDEREEYANTKRFNDADEIIVKDLSNTLENYLVTDNDFLVIVTNAHTLDKEALKQVVNKEMAYIGLIGSTKKIKHVMKELINEGIEEEKLRKVFAPMGINIATNEPAEIALAIMSEILLVKNNGSLHHRRDLRKVWD